MIDQVQSTRLANGLTILSEHMPGLRSISFGIWVRRGSRHESPALNGICHFIEHAVFKGSERRTAKQIATESDRLGGHLDAYTAHEITGFALKVVDTALPQAFDLLTDLVARWQPHFFAVSRARDWHLRSRDHVGGDRRRRDRATAHGRGEAHRLDPRWTVGLG